jgi:hypothetical protein
MKYRGLKELSEGLMDKFLVLKDFKNQVDILNGKLEVAKTFTEIKENNIRIPKFFTERYKELYKRYGNKRT